MVAAVLAGCGGSFHDHSQGPEERGGVEFAGPFELVLERVIVARDGVDATLALDEPVFAGDDLALSVSSAQPAYVYVVNLAPDGTSDVVWPHEVPQIVEEPLRIPERSWFRLAGASGPEVVAVIASRDPIPLSRRGREILVAIARHEARRTDLAKLQATHPPGFFANGHATMGIRARGLRTQGGAVRVQSGDDRVVLLLDLDHRPRG